MCLHTLLTTRIIGGCPTPAKVFRTCAFDYTRVVFILSFSTSYHCIHCWGFLSCTVNQQFLVHPELSSQSGILHKFADQTSQLTRVKGWRLFLAKYVTYFSNLTSLNTRQRIDNSSKAMSSIRSRLHRSCNY